MASSTRGARGSRPSRSTRSCSAASTTTPCSTWWSASAAPASSCASSNTWMSVTATTGVPSRWCPRRSCWRGSAQRWPLEPLEPGYRGEVAQRYAFADGRGEMGFISSVTQPFCGDCTRARLSSDGVLYTCLFATQGTICAMRCAGGASDDRAAGAHPRRLARARRPLQRAARQPARCRERCSARSKCTISVADDTPQPHAPQPHAPQPHARGLTHLNARRQPTMVDVGAKEVTHRVAEAEARVRAARSVARALRGERAPHQQGPGVRHGDRRRRHGGQAHRRAHPLLPSAADRELPAAISTHQAAGAASYAARCRDASPHRCGDGGAHRRRRGRADDLRHVQGAFARYRDRQRSPARENRWPARFARAKAERRTSSARER